MDAQPLLWIVPISGLVAVLVAGYFAYDVLRSPIGTPEMQKVAGAIYVAAVAFIKRQYRTIFLLALGGMVLIGVVIYFFESAPGVSATELAIRTSIAFFVGAMCSMASGIIGMFVAVKSNLRTAAAAQHSIGDALRIALRGGAVSGILVVGLSLIGVFVMFIAYGGFEHPDQAPFTIVGFGFGASFVALFAQLGGGIYTKAADLGADLVGKVEAGIPEDDPRNAAVIADLVGDNVGDCAGRGADLFESTAAENIGAMILGVAIYAVTQNVAWILFPLVVRGFGLIASVIGIFLVRGNEQRDPMGSLNSGYYITLVLSIVGMFFVTNQMLNEKGAFMYFFGAGVVGLLTSLAFVYITQYYTSGNWRPVKEIAEAAKTGPATTIISGTAVGFETTASSTITIAIALFASHWLGDQWGIATGPAARRHLRHRRRHDGHADERGVHPRDGHLRTDHRQRRRRRVDVARFGRDARAHRPPRRRGQHHQGADEGLRRRVRRSRRVPAVLGLSRQGRAADRQAVHHGRPRQGRRLPRRLPRRDARVSLLVTRDPRRGRAGAAIIEEVRTQFREHPGIMAGTEEPDYARVVDITTASALRNMIAPGLLAILAPIVVGILLKAEAEAALLMVGTMSGVILATVLNNSGGAWDNAKKYIESGMLKDDKGNVLGKGTQAHAAAVVGDTVGDPFKDTAGPSLHVLIKLLATITLVLAPLFI